MEDVETYLEHSSCRFASRRERPIEQQGARIKVEEELEARP